MSTTFMHVHLVALRYFAASVRFGSMRQAAEQLNVAPSAVTRQILKLEDQLQCRLFDRRSEGVRLTAAGEVLYHYVLSLERSLDRVITQIDDLRGLRRGHVIISCEDGIARDLLPPVLSAFHTEFSRVTYSIEVASASEIMHRVAEGTVDIGIAMSPPSRQDLTPIVSRPIPLGAITPIDHPLVQRQTLRMQDLFGQPLIQMRDDMGDGTFLQANISRNWPRGHLIETNAPDSVTNLVKAGLGIGIRTPVGILDDIASRRIAFRPIHDPQVSWPKLNLYPKAQQNLSTAGSVLLERFRLELIALAERAAALAEVDNSDATAPVVVADHQAA